MIPAAKTANEQQRLEALRRYEILDSGNEKIFDDLTFLASHICQTPIALITLVDEDRQWFKSNIGIPLTETPREISFCGHAIHQPELFVVPDARTDERFADNPLVTGDPNIRFYAGAPMMTFDGYALGTVCVIDNKPRSITSDQRNALAALSRQASVLIEMRRTMKELHDAVNAIKLLGGIVPICASCKRIRDDHQEWVVLERYIQDRSDAQFSHGMCPDCTQKMYPDFFKNFSQRK